MVIRIESVDGVQLGCEYHPAQADRVRGVLLVSHAIMADSRSLDRPPGAGLASLLAQRGYHIYRLDVRGHGLSRRERPTWSYQDVYDRDLPAAVRAIAQRHPGLPLGVVGHSLTAHGGLIMLGRAPELPVRAFVGLAANIWLPHLEPSRGRWLMKRLLLESWWMFTRWLGYFPARRLRIGPADVSLGFVSGVLEAARRDRVSGPEGDSLLGRLSQVRCPVLLIAGVQDRLLAPAEDVARLSQYLPAGLVERWVVPGGHMTLVTCSSSRPTWNRLADWLDKTLVTT